ncbi:MAG: DUF2066 domain-containing protein [Neptuniibacter sp.]
MDFKRIVIATVLVLFSNVGSTAQIDSLYQAEIAVPVAQTGAPTPSQLSSALQQVLVKVAGRSDLLGNPTINAQLPVAEDYLQQFSYQPHSENGDTQEQSLLLDFNSIAVNGLMKHAGYKQLGSQRPTVLIWLASDQTGEQTYLTAESNVIKRFKKEADRRGLPLQLPIFDLEDQVSLPVSDLWGLFTNSIEKASARYLPDAVLAARLQTSDTGFNQVEWMILDRSNPQRHSTAGTLDQVIPELVNLTADQLFSPIVAPVSYDLSHFQSGLAVNISNITKFSDFIQATDYLRSLPIVKTVIPERVKGSDVTVRVALDGSSDLLKQALALEPRLQVLDFTYNADGSEVLNYYWQE